eukprot:6467553-Amphidinium_carterae.1
MFDTEYSGLSVFSELIVLAYLRSLHIGQEAMCRNIHGYPVPHVHAHHHPNSTRCLRVIQQRERIDHAFDHQWRVASNVNMAALSPAE